MRSVRAGERENAESIKVRVQAAIGSSFVIADNFHCELFALFCVLGVGVVFICDMAADKPDEQRNECCQNGDD